MNSENFQVVTIEVTNLVKTKELLISKAVELVEGDYAIRNPSHQCPTSDGSYPVGMPENWYLLGVSKGQQNPEFDNRILVENQFTRPIFEPHPEFPDYFQYRTDFSLVERTLDELISTIKQMEREANLSIQSEADKAKLEMFIPAVSAKYGVQPLTDPEQNVYTRMLELADKGAKNADNAASKLVRGIFGAKIYGFIIFPIVLYLLKWYENDILGYLDIFYNSSNGEPNKVIAS